MEFCRSKVLDLYDIRQIDVSEFIDPFAMDEDELNAELDRIRSRRGVMVDAERVEPDDFVRLDCRSGTPKFQKTSLELRVGKGLFSRELEAAMIGMEPGETKTVTLSDAEAEVTIRSIRRRILPALTDELVASWDLDGVHSVEDLKKDLYAKAKGQYVEEVAEPLAAALSQAVNERSRFELDPEEVLAVEAEGREMAADMLRSAGVDPETADDEAVRAVAGRTKAEHFEFLRYLSVDGLKSAAIGAAQMKAEGASVTEEDYHKALAYNAEGLGVSVEEAARIMPWPKFLRQTAANNNFEKIVAFAKAWLNKED